MQRPYPCFVCSRTETSITHAQNPWCSDNCHKRLSRILGMQQWDLTALSFESAMRRLANTLLDDEPHCYTNEITREIARGRNWREVYGTEVLLREAERPGNWRDSGLRDTLEGWIVPSVR